MLFRQFSRILIYVTICYFHRVLTFFDILSKFYWLYSAIFLLQKKQHFKKFDWSSYVILAKSSLRNVYYWLNKANAKVISKWIFRSSTSNIPKLYVRTYIIFVYEAILFYFFFLPLSQTCRHSDTQIDRQTDRHNLQYFFYLRTYVRMCY